MKEKAYKRAVIFDMDGVLVDSEPLYVQRILQFFHQNKQALTRREAIAFVGASDAFYWRHMGELWQPSQTPEQMQRFYEKTMREEEVDYGAILNPYVRYLLPRLKQAGFGIAVASASARSSIMRMAQENDLSAWLDGIVSGQDVARNKPAPDIYEEALRRLSCMPKDCCVIEDSAYGIQAAKAAGLYVIAKREPRFALDQSGADEIADDLLDAYSCILEHFQLPLAV